ncbi:uncharacterized protein LOC143651699 [Tamandua tetradactyla]|uniref:uncharacterized protein LOC143651699 n=1 Tax=Tamandua tetradactyla TaxID=48850 RepID=UPI0040539517
MSLLEGGGWLPAYSAFSRAGAVSLESGRPPPPEFAFGEFGAVAVTVSGPLWRSLLSRGRGASSAGPVGSPAAGVWLDSRPGPRRLNARWPDELLDNLTYQWLYSSI